MCYIAYATAVASPMLHCMMNHDHTMVSPICFPHSLCIYPSWLKATLSSICTVIGPWVSAYMCFSALCLYRAMALSKGSKLIFFT